MIYPEQKRYRWPEFHRDYRLGVHFHTWIIVWKWNGKFRHIGRHYDVRYYNSIRRPW